MKCYLINLDRAPELLKRMRQLLDRRGVEFERIAAVDAKIQSYKLAPAVTRTPGGRAPLAPGDIACGASHLICLRKIASGEDRYGAILEDDLHLADDIAFFLKSDHWLPTDADLVKVETFRQVTLLCAPLGRLPGKRSIWRLMERHWGAGAYIVSKSAAQRIIREYDNEIQNIDVFLFDIELANHKVYQVSPAPAIQDTFCGSPSAAFLASDIQPQRQAVDILKLKGWPKFRREFLRLGRQIYILLLVCWFKAFSRKRYGKVPFRP